jgi:hypothetical protein
MPHPSQGRKGGAGCRLIMCLIVYVLCECGQTTQEIQLLMLSVATGGDDAENCCCVPVAGRCRRLHASMVFSIGCCKGRAGAR